MKQRHDVAPLANAARELMKAGDAVGAERVLSPIFGVLRSDASVLHLMGQIKQAQNQMEEAERHFRSAVAYSLDNPGYYNDLGVVLSARGNHAEAVKVFRATLALTPSAAVTRVHLVRALLAAGDLGEAERETRAYIASSDTPEAWTLLSQVQRAQGHDEEALVSSAEALNRAPALRGLQMGHAQALERVGRNAEALQAYHQMALQSIDTPDLALHLTRALYQAGALQEAEETAEGAVQHWPDSVALQATLARMRQLRGEGEAATALIEKQIAAQPDNFALRLACADALHRGHHNHKALRLLEQSLARAPGSLPLLTAYGILLDEIDRPDEGLVALRRVVELSGGDRAAQRNLLSTLFRAGRPDEAQAVARALRQDDPFEQYLIACEALALRMLGRPEYRQIYDYERFVRSYEIPAPRGFFTVPNFNAALADVLRLQHKDNAHPLDQQLLAGTQTGRSLLALDEPNLRAFIAAVEAAVRDYISRLEGPDIFASRKTERFRWSGLWSTRLPNGGFMPNHVHDRGWISSAYFVALTPAAKPNDERAGWLKLGEPNRPPKNCAPEAFVEPKEGRLVLFPSFMWHGTVPFEGDERLSMAFEVAPA